ncbi:MAG: PKD domain-containing protein [Acidobacteriota bacterium]|nr:PKD domain-containing protein [Acidobacteriota bacterium]
MAQVATVEGQRVGLEERVSSTIYAGNQKLSEAEGLKSNPAVRGFGNPGGNPVMHRASVYAIYWDPGDWYHGDWQEVFNTFLTDLSATNGTLGSVLAVGSQYSDATGQPAAGGVAFKGASTDTAPYPASGCVDPRPLATGPEAFEFGPNACLTDRQVREQLASYLAANGLQGREGMETVFVVLTPPGVAVCLDAGGPTGHCSDYEKENAESLQHSFCSYHSYIPAGAFGSAPAASTLYTMIPWSAGGLGDFHLPESAQEGATPCQEGNYSPEVSTFVAKPVQQEPNQIPNGIGPDGTYDHGLADLIVNQTGVELVNTITDPLLNAWTDESGKESADECRNDFLPKLGGSYGANEKTRAGSLYDQVYPGGNYDVNTAFDLAAIKVPYPGVPCLPGASLVPTFTLPAVAYAGELVGFDGMESNVTLNWAGLTLASAPTYATFTWNFGDGTPLVTGYAAGAPPCSTPWLSPCAASPFHAYQYGGQYKVSLTVKDVGGNVSTANREITIVGPLAPSGPGGASGGSSGGSGAHPLPAPVARAAAASGSLRAAIRHGLAVNYSVNEQVAGVVEALLNARTAHRLRIRGPLAAGLPRGYPRSIVIGRAVLVTRRGGHGTLRLRFTRAVARALSRVRRVTVTLRMVVRNAERSHPQTSTLISTVTLTNGSARRRRSRRG